MGGIRDLVTLVRHEAERDFGALVPPLRLHSPAPDSLAAAWLMLRAALVEPGLVDRTTKEATATAVALANSCWYCAELHVAALESRNELRPSADTELTTLADHRIRQITEWARTAGMREDIGPRRPFGDQHVPELVGTVVACHYLNRMTTVFLPAPVPGADPPDDPRPLLDLVAAQATRTPEPGATLDLLPAAPLPADLAWAAGQPDIAAAFARAAAAIDAAGIRSVPEAVRSMVSARMAAWHGAAPDADLAWLADEVADLAPADRPAGRLALLTALAPHRVDKLVIDMFRQGGADERTLVELTSWASFTAARRVGAWLSSGVAPVDTTSRVLPFRRRTRTSRPTHTSDPTTTSGLGILSP